MEDSKVSPSSPSAPKTGSQNVQSDIDAETGRRARTVFLRDENEASAMNGIQRLKYRLNILVRHVCGCNLRNGKKKDDDVDDVNATFGNNTTGRVDDEDSETGRGGGRRAIQYRLETADEAPTRTLSTRLASLSTCFCLEMYLRLVNGSGVGIKSRHQWLTQYLHWMFRVNFMFLFAIMCVSFYAWTIFFAGLIVAAGVMDPQCVRVGGLEFGTYGSRFADAFSLSWTTFSSVGYGSTAPALENQNDNRTHCAFIAAICALEVFVGVLYGGFCGAILFGKVLRLQSHAQVVFSDPIVVRYGSGVEDESADEIHLDDESSKDRTATTINSDTTTATHEKTIPLPVLEFRIVNKSCGEEGGEIMDAELNVVANINATDVEPSVRDAFDPEVRWKKAASSILHSLKKGSMHDLLASHSNLEAETESSELTESTSSDNCHHTNSPQAKSRRTNFADPFASFHGALRGGSHHGGSHHGGSLHGGSHHGGSMHGFDSHHHNNHHLHYHHHQAVDEDPTSRLVTKRIFSKLSIEASSHPFFKRVWVARHVLDETSPILKPRIRRQIHRLGGHWPTHLNTHEGVRDSIQFNQILVSLTGVSNVSAAKVYAQKIYDYVDVNVGYQFVNIFFSGQEDELQLDIDLINDVREQNGGGGEPLILVGED